MPAEADRCPVCLRPAGPAVQCAHCGWPLRSGYFLGYPTEQDERRLDERCRASQRRFDLAAAVRAAGYPGDGDPDLLDRLVEFARERPDPGEVEEAVRSAAEGAPPTGATGTAPAAVTETGLRRLAAELTGRQPEERPVALVEVDAEQVLISAFIRDETGEVCEEADAVVLDWPALVPGLADDPIECRFQLAGGVGRHSVDESAAGRALTRAVPGSGQRDVLLVNRVAGWTVPEAALAVLRARHPAAREVRAPAREPTGRTLVLHTAAPLTAFAAAPSGAPAFVGAGLRDGSVTVWRLPGGDAVSTRTQHDGRVTALDVSADGQLVVTGGRDFSVMLAVVGSAGGPHVLRVHLGQVTGVRLRGESVFSLGDDGRLHRTPFAGNVGVGLLRGLLVDGLVERAGFPVDVGVSASAALAVSDEGQRVATGGTDTVVRVFDADSGERVTALPAVGGRVTALSFDPFGNLVAVAAADGSVTVCDLSSCQVLTRLPGFGAAVRALALDASGALLTGDDAGYVRCWQQARAAAASTVVVGRHRGVVRGVAWHGDGAAFSAGSDGVIRRWPAPPAPTPDEEET